MWIVKNKAELVRYSAYLVIVGALVFVLMKGLGPWLKTSAAPPASAEQPVMTESPLAPQATSDAADTSTRIGSDFFAVYRVDRDRARSELKETLREVMASATAEEETRQEANRRYMFLGQAAEVERRAESLLKAKGFDDAIVELADGNVQVIIRAPQMDKNKAAQVIDIVARLSGVQPQQINIITRGF